MSYINKSSEALLKNTQLNNQNPHTVGMLQGREIYRHPNYTPKLPPLNFVHPVQNGNFDQEKMLTAKIRNQRSVEQLLNLIQSRGLEFNPIHFFETRLQERIDYLPIEQCVDSIQAQSSLAWKNLEFVERLTNRSISLIRKSENYTYVFNALSQVGYCNKEWCESVCKKIVDGETQFQTYEKVIILQSVTKLGLDSKVVKDLALVILDAPDFDRMYLEDQAAFLLSFTFLFENSYSEQIHPKIEAICAILTNQVQVDRIKPKQTMLFQAMALSGYDLEKTQEYLAQLEPEEPDTSLLQLEVKECLEKVLMKKNLTIEIEKQILHTSVDIFIDGGGLLHNPITYSFINFTTFSPRAP